VGCFDHQFASWQPYFRIVVTVCTIFAGQLFLALSSVEMPRVSKGKPKYF